MFSKFIALSCIAFCIVQGSPADNGPMGCAGANVTFPDQLKTKLEACGSKKMDPKSDKMTDEEKKKAFETMKACPIVCTGKDLGLLDAAGKPVKDKIAAFITTSFPAATTKDITTGANECIEKHEKSLVVKEGDCSSYNELVDCTSKLIMKVCMPGKST